MVPVSKRNNLFGRVWADDDVTAVEDQPADPSAGLTNLGFLRGAIRRGAWLWGALALAGLLLGAAAPMLSPSVYQASTTLLLKVGPEAAPGTAIQNEQVVAQSRPVAALALKELNLREDPSSFMQSYTATVVTDQALLITVNAPTSDEATTRARVLAAAFLQFRASMLHGQQRNYFRALNQDISQQMQVINTLSRQIREVSAQPPSSTQRAKLGSLLSQRKDAYTTLKTIQQNAASEVAATQAVTDQQVNQSKVVNPAAPILQSRHAGLKHTILYSITGLIVGFALGLAIVIIRALVSDHLRRRDDVAYALGAPVKLSVGKVERRRLLPGRTQLTAVQGTDVQRIAAHLRRAVPQTSRGASSLALVPVDSTQAAALSVVALALSCAERGRRVVVADLAPGSPAASLMDTAEPGVRRVSVEGRELVLVVPEADDDMPPGPLGTSRLTHPALASAAKSADLLLTLIAIDPALGGEHLATWATDAVIMVTAGRSSWTKIHAAGEMIRLAGTRLVSAVLVGADKTDESLGVTGRPGPGPDVDVMTEGVRVDAERSLLTREARRSEGPAPGS